MKMRPLYKVRSIDNLKEMLEQSEKLFSKRFAFRVKDRTGNYEGVTYSQFKNDVDALGTVFTDLGLKDEHIAVLGENRYEWCVTYLSVVNGVGVIVPLDKELPVSELEMLLARSKASAIVFSGKYSDEIKKISCNLKNIKYFIHMDLDQDEPESGFLSYKKLAQRGKELVSAGNKSFLDAHIDNEKMHMLLFTSGTTDMSKGVMLSHKNICSNITSVCSTVSISPEDSSLSILPLHHTYECTLGFLALIYNGAAISFNEGLKYIAKNLKEIKPTILITVPLILESMYRKIWDQASKKRGTKSKLKAAILISNLLLKLLKVDIRRSVFKEIHENIGGRIRLIITGAAAINPKVSKGLREMGILVLQGYGLTECSPLAIGNRDHSYIDGSVGFPIPGVEVKINRPDENGIGEILVKGDNVMLGYFQNEEATDKCIKGDWFYTGDLGYRDPSGFYYITGRNKNVIVTKNGKNIYPEELEACINQSPYVQESLVWGKYDEVSGETMVNAQIFPNLDAIKDRLKEISITKEEIFKVLDEVIRNVNRNIPLYKRIRSFTIRDSEFIKTTTKKIKRYIEKAKPEFEYNK